MEIKFSGRETSTLKKLLFIGKFLVNCNRKAEKDERVNALFYKVICEELRSEWIEPTHKATDKAVERIYDEAMACISDYEKQSVLYALAVLLAERDYQGNGERERLARTVAQAILEEELEKKGLSIVKTEISDFEKRVEEIVSEFLVKLAQKNVWDM